MPLFQLPVGFKLFYELNGPTGTPAIVFLSGLTGDHNNWWLQVQSFVGSYRCLTFDWRDTGHSEVSPAPDYDLATLADDVAALTSGLNLGPSHLVGLSMGGAVAQEVALHYPAQVASLTLASSFAFRPLPSILPADKRTSGNLRHWEAITRHDTQDRLRSLNVPTLVIAGSRDGVTPPAAQEAYAALIPGAKFVLIEGTGHLVQVEKAGQFNRTLRSFIETAVTSDAN